MKTNHRLEGTETIRHSRRRQSATSVGDAQCVERGRSPGRGQETTSRLQMLSRASLRGRDRDPKALSPGDVG